LINWKHNSSVVWNFAKKKGLGLPGPRQPLLNNLASLHFSLTPQIDRNIWQFSAFAKSAAEMVARERDRANQEKCYVLCLRYCSKSNKGSGKPATEGRIHKSRRRSLSLSAIHSGQKVRKK